MGNQTSVHRFIDEAGAKKTLKENEGLGTEATRTGIVETLRQRDYIKADKINLVSTDLGQNIIKKTKKIRKYYNTLTRIKGFQSIETQIIAILKNAKLVAKSITSLVSMKFQTVYHYLSLAITSRKIQTVITHEKSSYTLV